MELDCTSCGEGFEVELFYEPEDRSVGEPGGFEIEDISLGSPDGETYLCGCGAKLSGAEIVARAAVIVAEDAGEARADARDDW